MGLELDDLGLTVCQDLRKSGGCQVGEILKYAVECLGVLLKSMSVDGRLGEL